MAKEKVFSYVKDDERVPMQKLSILDQVFVLLRKLTFDASAEIKKADLLTKETLRLKADLIDLLLGATEPIRRGEHKSVHLSVSSKFDLVFNDVINLKRFTTYYVINVKRPALEYDVDHFFDVWLEVRK